MTTTVPTDLKHSECERGDPAKNGGAPPICFVIETLASKEDAPTASIYTSEEVKETFHKFKEGSAEEMIEHVRTFWEIIRKLDLEDYYENTSLILEGQKHRLSEGNAHGRKLRELKESIDSTALDLKKTINRAFKTFTDLLDADVVQKWNDIVKKECRTKGYVGPDGVRVNNRKRGETFEGLRASIRTLLRQNGVPQDGAERLKRYLTCQVKKASRVAVVPFIDRMLKLNSYIEDLPCLKDEEGAPDIMPRAQDPFNDMELCTHILTALPSGFSVAYWARKGKHFPVDVEKLKDDLELIEPEFQQKQKMMD